MLKRTPLFEAHRRLGARLVEFGGWEMPVQYTSIMEEHLAVRRAAGVFDISHMGEVQVEGPGALEFLNHLLTHNAALLQPGQGQYSLMCNPQGGVLDDLYLYRLRTDQFLMVINASRIESDLAWIEKQARNFNPRVRVEDRSGHLGAVAVQGPAAAAFIDKVLPGPVTGGTLVPGPSRLGKNHLLLQEGERGELLVARTGYTGEDGFELIAPAAEIQSVWDRLFEQGRAFGLVPAGLGARDTLRTEACFPLYGHELAEQFTPLEAGLGFFVALDKPSFIGRDALVQQKAGGLPRRCVAFRMTQKGAPPRAGYPIHLPGGSRVGEVTSGTLSPSLGTGIGMGYVPPEHARPGTLLEIEIRGRRHPAEVAAKPLYRKESKTL